VFESGGAFERITDDADDVVFNAADDETEPDDESTASGPEPEGVAVGRVAGEQYAFIGLEEVGGVVAFNVTNPEEREPEFVDYVNSRDVSVDPESEIGRLAPTAASRRRGWRSSRRRTARSTTCCSPSGPR
jgi:hypothetical protein